MDVPTETEREMHAAAQLERMKRTLLAKTTSDVHSRIRKAGAEALKSGTHAGGMDVCSEKELQLHATKAKMFATLSTAARGGRGGGGDRGGGDRGGFRRGDWHGRDRWYGRYHPPRYRWYPGYGWADPYALDLLFGGPNVNNQFVLAVGGRTGFSYGGTRASFRPFGGNKFRVRMRHHGPIRTRSRPLVALSVGTKGMDTPDTMASMPMSTYARVGFQVAMRSYAVHADAETGKEVPVYYDYMVNVPHNAGDAEENFRAFQTAVRMHHAEVENTLGDGNGGDDSGCGVAPQPASRADMYVVANGSKKGLEGCMAPITYARKQAFFDLRTYPSSMSYVSSGGTTLEEHVPTPPVVVITPKTLGRLRGVDFRPEAPTKPVPSSAPVAATPPAAEEVSVVSTGVKGRRMVATIAAPPPSAEAPQQSVAPTPSEAPMPTGEKFVPTPVHSDVVCADRSCGHADCIEGRGLSTGANAGTRPPGTMCSGPCMHADCKAYARSRREAGWSSSGSGDSDDVFGSKGHPPRGTTCLNACEHPECALDTGVRGGGMDVGDDAEDWNSRAALTGCCNKCMGTGCKTCGKHNAMSYAGPGIDVPSGSGSGSWDDSSDDEGAAAETRPPWTKVGYTISGIHRDRMHAAKLDVLLTSTHLVSALIQWAAKRQNDVTVVTIPSCLNAILGAGNTTFTNVSKARATLIRRAFTDAGMDMRERATIIEEVDGILIAVGQISTAERKILYTHNVDMGSQRDVDFMVVAKLSTLSSSCACKVCLAAAKSARSL